MTLKTTIDGLARANEPYVRTDAELAYQKQYEAKEASKHLSAARVYYRVVESAPPPDIISRKTAFRVARKIDEKGKEEMSRWIFVRKEVADYLREQTRKDEDAAKRLGLQVHVTVTR